MTLLIGSKQRLAAIVALQANLDSQRLNAVPTAHFHQHQRALFRCGHGHFLGSRSMARSRTDHEFS